MKRISDYVFLELYDLQSFIQIAQLMDSSGKILCIDFCMDTNQIVILESPDNEERIPARFIRNSQSMNLYEVSELLGYDQMIIDSDDHSPLQIRVI